MNGKELLIGLSHIDRKYIEESENDTIVGNAGELTKIKPRKRTFHKSFLIAAIIALMLLLVGCTVVAMRLRHLTMDTAPYSDFWGEERTILSLQGFQGSPSYEAFQEWQKFLDSYDPDNAILYANNDFESPDAYYSYGCYSQEMVDKAEEICERYGLEPLGKPWVYRKFGHIFEAVGIQSVFSANTKVDSTYTSGYCYNDGTFHLEGDLELGEPRNRLVGFSYRSVQKTSFDGVSSSVGDLDTYDQWEYTMKDGTKVLLALREDEGRVFVDKKDSFVVVTAAGPTLDIYAQIPNERAFLEDFCEAFDFSYQTQRVDPDNAYALECEEEPHTYAEWIKYLMEEHSAEYPNLMYAFMDINDDGVDELLLHCDSLLNTEQNGDKNSFFSLKSMRGGRLVHLVGDGIHYLCQGNVLETLSPFESEPKSHEYYQFDQDHDLVFVAEIVYSAEEGKLYQHIPDDLVEISEEDADAIVAQFPRIDIDFKPASKFQESGTNNQE